MVVPFRIGCDNIAYRRGFIEVQPQIHPGNVNVEVWQADPNVSIAGKWVSDESIPDDSIIANVELELTPTQARLLAESLLAAVSVAERK